MNKTAGIAIIVIVLALAAWVYMSQTNIYTVTVRGALAGSDISQSKELHNQIAAGGKATANSLGDISHTVFLGLANNSDFLAFDQWTSFEGLQTFSSNPQVQQAFGQLFATPPQISVWRQQSDYASWGSFNDVKSAGPGIYVVTVRGRLRAAGNEAKAAHNQVAEGGKQIANSLGDTTHLAFLSTQDAQEFMGIDVWTNLTGLQQFSSDPNVAAAFGQLFDGPPTITVWTQADWLRW